MELFTSFCLMDWSILYTKCGGGGIRTNVVAMLLGNSLAIIENEAVRKAAFPRASTIRIINARLMKG